MEILNVGPLELIIILALMFIVLGPKDMVKTAQRIGRWVRSITSSPQWREIWGMSQDIRELPKKLMEETGLEEALTDVRQTTQQVADELNTTLNEAKEAARVPEVEHLRIENPLTTPPPPEIVPAVLSTTSDVPTAAAEAAEAEAAEAEAEAAVTETAAAEAAPQGEVTGVPAGDTADASSEALPPAVLAVAEPAAAADMPVVKKPRRKKQVPAIDEQAAPEEQAAPIDQAVESQPAESAPVVKKPRRKKVAAVAEQPVTEEQAAAEAPVAADQPAVAVYSVADQAPETTAPEGQPEAAPVVVKKPRRKKQDAVGGEQTPAAKQTPAAEQAPAAEQPPAAKQTQAAEQSPVPAELVPAPVPEADTSAALPVAESAPPKRRARARKPVQQAPQEAGAVPQAEQDLPAAVPEAPAAAALDANQPGNNGAAPAPRKRRAPRTSRVTPPEAPAGEILSDEMGAPTNGNGVVKQNGGNGAIPHAAEPDTSFTEPQADSAEPTGPDAA